MRKVSFTAGLCLLAACASAPEVRNEWFNPGAGGAQYAADNAACADAAAGARADGSSDLRVNPQSDYGRAGAAAGSSGSGGANELTPVGGGGAELSTNMYDVAALARYNAAVAARNQASARERVLAECMSARGYRVLSLSPEQAARLVPLAHDSDERAEALRALAASRHKFGRQEKLLAGGRAASQCRKV